MDKKKVAVVFGGPSQEHDVSVVSAQQLMDAADVRKIDIVPVYLDFEGRFFHGPALRDLNRFRPRPSGLKEVRFAWGDMGACIAAVDGSWSKQIDCALPVFHGPYGEDGRIQGMLEIIGIPTTGFSATNSALAMRKDVTKSLVREAGVNVLPHIVVNRSELRNTEALLDRIEESNLGYPLIVKPANLGSSIGVGLAKDRTDLGNHVQAALHEDTTALVEPQVQNLEELNIAVMYRDGEVRFSAIERPKPTSELLDFKEKYLSSSEGGPMGSEGKLGNTAVPSQGMLSLTRDINPDIAPEHFTRVRHFAERTFFTLGLRGAPRLDFMHNTETGEIWFNEINPIPGSYGFFLWEAAEEPVLFPKLIEHLVEEATADTIKRFEDPVPQEAHLLPRR